MGYIYKVTNLINSHIYIGQTRISIAQRWRDHCRVSHNPNSEEYAFPLHRAIRKYGAENFEIKEIEQCSEEQLDEREIYWIQYYNSYYDGYNSSLGGSGHVKYDYNQIVNFYLSNNFSLVETCIFFGINDQVVYSALKGHGIDYKKLSSKTKRIGYLNRKNQYKILLVEKKLIFNTMKEVNEFFQKKAHPNVRRCLNGLTEKAYGFHWKEITQEEITNDMVYFRPSSKS